MPLCAHSSCCCSTHRAPRRPHRRGDRRPAAARRDLPIGSKAGDRGPPARARREHGRARRRAHVLDVQRLLAAARRSHAVLARTPRARAEGARRARGSRAAMHPDAVGAHVIGRRRRAADGARRERLFAGFVPGAGFPFRYACASSRNGDTYEREDPYRFPPTSPARPAPLRRGDARALWQFGAHPMAVDDVQERASPCGRRPRTAVSVVGHFNRCDGASTRCARSAPAAWGAVRSRRRPGTCTSTRSSRARGCRA